MKTEFSIIQFPLKIHYQNRYTLFRLFKPDLLKNVIAISGLQ